MVSRWNTAVRRSFPWMRKIRRELHTHPELAYRESRTQRRILETLAELSIDGSVPAGSTGVVATLGRQLRGPVVAIRADMDGLPVTETTGAPFRSVEPGVMHACGHDLHMSVVLGVAKVASEHPDWLGGPLRLIFQPAEEDGLRGGAGPMIQAGALGGPAAAFVLGEHVDESLPVGTIGVHPGPTMAAADTLEIYVRGTGGHAAYPHRGTDTVLAAAEVVVGMQAMVSRRRDPLDPGLISLSQIHGGDRPNILPSEVRLAGTVRTFSPGLRRQFAREIPRRVRLIARSLGAEARVKYRWGYPAVVNDPGVTAKVAAACRAAWGHDRVVDLERAVMGAEDFSRYLQQVPGTFWFLGVASRTHPAAAKHSPQFLPDERAMVTGADAFLAAADALQRRSP
ncbi:MAG TPA: M20 family metallopeptidase [Thermoplasmata archaeon]|nr:M20 family metallopeptidase [Thermoplasmata archaeon]